MLTKKNERFCQEYLIDLNTTQAAIRAGYSQKTAYSIGHEILKKPEAEAYIKQLQDARQERTGITADMVLQEIAKTAFSNIKSLYDETGRLLQPHELSDDVASSIISFKTRTEATQGDNLPDVIEEYRRHDKLKALELIGKHLGMFTDKIEHSGSIDSSDITITIEKE